MAETLRNTSALLVSGVTSAGRAATVAPCRQLARALAARATGQSTRPPLSVHLNLSWFFGLVHVETCDRVIGAERFCSRTSCQWQSQDRVWDWQKTHTGRPSSPSPQYRKWLLSGRKSCRSKEIKSQRTRSHPSFLTDSGISGASPA